MDIGSHMMSTKRIGNHLMSARKGLNKWCKLHVLPHETGQGHFMSQDVPCVLVGSGVGSMRCWEHCACLVPHAEMQESVYTCNSMGSQAGHVGTNNWVVVSWDERQCIFARVQTYLFRKVTEFKKKMTGTASEGILQKGHFL